MKVGLRFRTQGAFFADAYFLSLWCCRCKSGDGNRKSNNYLNIFLKNCIYATVFDVVEYKLLYLVTWTFWGQLLGDSICTILFYNTEVANYGSKCGLKAILKKKKKNSLCGFVKTIQTIYILNIPSVHFTVPGSSRLLESHLAINGLSPGDILEKWPIPCRAIQRQATLRDP